VSSCHAGHGMPEPEWGLVAGLPDRPGSSRGRERIPCSILDDEKLWKGERRKQRTRASVRRRVDGTARSAWEPPGSWARMSVSREEEAGCAGAGYK
jgi:hypothetical protein